MTESAAHDYGTVGRKSVRPHGLWASVACALLVVGAVLLMLVAFSPARWEHLTARTSS